MNIAEKVGLTLVIMTASYGPIGDGVVTYLVFVLAVVLFMAGGVVWHKDV